jgi:Mg-chelatase subunit ChlD
MKPDFSHLSPEEQESRITALLLGETSPEEADDLRDLIAHDPALRLVCDRLKQTINLVREAAHTSEGVSAAVTSSTAQRLSPARRQVLLQAFKTPPKLPIGRKREFPWYIPMSLAAGLVALLALPEWFVDGGLVRHFNAPASSLGGDVNTVLDTAAKSAGRTPLTGAERLAESPTPVIKEFFDTATSATDNREERLVRRRFSAGRSQTADIGLKPSEAPQPVPTPAKRAYAFGVTPPPSQPQPQPQSGNADGSFAGIGGGGGGGGFGAFSTTEGKDQNQEPAPAVAVDGVARGGAARVELRRDNASRELLSKSVRVLEEARLAEKPADNQLAFGAATDSSTALGLRGAGALAAGQTDRNMAGESLVNSQPDHTAVLGDLPAFGRLFRSETDQAAKAIPAPELSAGVQGGAFYFDAGSTDKLAVPSTMPAQSPAAALPAPERARAKVELAAESEVLGKPAQMQAVDVAQDLPKQKSDEAPIMLGVIVQKLEAAERASASDLKLETAPEAKLKKAAPAPEPQPEVQTADQPFSTFSLNVSDVSFKLAATSLEQGVLPEPASVRCEEFLNAFDYHDPLPAPGLPLSLAFERALYPFSHGREVIRLSVKTASQGREAGRPLNLVLVLDNSGSMERADRVSIIHEAIMVLAKQLKPQDRVSVIAFARTARLWVDALPGSDASQLADRISELVPDGGTNLEDALDLAYQTAMRHFLAGGVNRLVLLTDGAANLGNTDPVSLKRKVEQYRKQGIALDCYGVGWEGYNDDLLEVLSRNGDGRYGFINDPAEASTEFVRQLAGALEVAAADVKVQVEFNPQRVTAYRQVGYAKHQLKQQDFRDNAVDAAEIGAAESGNALYVIETNPQGTGPLGVVRVRFKVPSTIVYEEHEWPMPYSGSAVAWDQSSPAMRLAITSAAFSEWLTQSPFGREVNLTELQRGYRNVPAAFPLEPRPSKLETMIRQAQSLSGK